MTQCLLFARVKVNHRSFIRTFWLRWVLLQWQCGWLKTRLSNWVLSVTKKTLTVAGFLTKTKAINTPPSITKKNNTDSAGVEQ